jgi:predicted metallo-beta-lactamase superfamily hydrolase
LAKWRDRYEDRVERWRTEAWVAEPPFARYADGERITVGDTEIRFLGPWLHGIEYARTGWVLPVVVETPETTFLHSSDLQGPVIEDDAQAIVDEDPDVLFLDGPATYLLGPMLNWTNLQRSIDNAAWSLREVDPELMVFDHHLLREPKYRQRTSEVWELAGEGYNVQTVAETRGEEPMIDRVSRWSEADEQAERERVEG